jgi:hypothetical protein
MVPPTAAPRCPPQEIALHPRSGEAHVRLDRRRRARAVIGEVRRDHVPVRRILSTLQLTGARRRRKLRRGSPVPIRRAGPGFQPPGAWPLRSRGPHAAGAGDRHQLSVLLDLRRTRRRGPGHVAPLDPRATAQARHHLPPRRPHRPGPGRRRISRRCSRRSVGVHCALRVVNAPTGHPAGSGLVPVRDTGQRLLCGRGLVLKNVEPGTGTVKLQIPPEQPSPWWPGHARESRNSRRPHAQPDVAFMRRGHIGPRGPTISAAS